MSERENFDDQVSRVDLMAAGNGDWDLSDNDTTALRAVLDALATTRSERDDAEAARQDWMGAARKMTERAVGAEAERDAARSEVEARENACAFHRYDALAAVKALLDAFAGGPTLNVTAAQGEAVQHARDYLSEFGHVESAVTRERNAAVARASAAEATAERLRVALRNLLVWAEWVKAKIHRSPHMDEPNTGAILGAREALAASTGKAEKAADRYERLCDELDRVWDQMSPEDRAEWNDGARRRP